MSNCIKDLYDYDLVKKCSKCGIVKMKSIFYKDCIKKDGYKSECIFCSKEYYYVNRDWVLNNRKTYVRKNRTKINLYQKKRRDSDLNFKLAHNLRVRTNKAFKSQNVRKTNKTLGLLGCSHSFFKNWIIHQLYGNMTLENYGSVWQIDHCLAVASFNLLDENDMKKCFNWVNLRPMHLKDNIIKGDKIDIRLYLLQEKKAYQFIKLNIEGPNEDIHQ